jgi:hypothetical protein
MDYVGIINKYSEYLRDKYFGVIPRKELFVLFQMMYRLFAVENERYTVLHASCALTETGKAILFGDDGYKSQGKSLLSLALAFKSGFYVSDEHTILDNNSGEVFGNTNAPINLKAGTKETLEHSFEIKLKNDRIIFPSDYFPMVEKAKPSILIVPYLIHKEATRWVPLETKEKELVHKATMFAHDIKLLNPDYDKLSFLREGKLNELKDMKKILESYEKRDLNIPTFKLLINLKDIGRVEDSIMEMLEYGN